MKNIGYILIGLAVGYFLFKKKKKKYSITQSIETLTEEQWNRINRKVGELPNQC